MSFYKIKIKNLKNLVYFFLNEENKKLNPTIT